ncbi:MAG: multicopper oxidase domain-containing protein, partial [Casimicrobiaceae bacterium]
REAGYLGDEMLVNGIAHAWLDVETRGYRLRILTACNARTLRLALRGDDGALLPMTLLGTDGGLLARPIECRELFVATAERVDLWVDFAAHAIGDSIVLESLAFDPMHGETHSGSHAPPPVATQAGDAHAAHGATTTQATVAQHGASQSAIGDGARLSLLQFRVRQRVVATAAPPSVLSTLPFPPLATGDPVAFRLSFAKSRWRINDRVFDMQGEPLLVPRNTVQTWLLRNYYTSMPHAMHLHGFTLRVLARETSPDFLAPLAIDANGRLPADMGAKDTVLVWPGESVRVAIDFSCPFAGPQDYLLHCHNLEHEDGGMMLRVRVV